jgi:hypothetical protein
MFWWFKRGDDYVRYEARQTGARAYELRFINVDGTERVEVFGDEEALSDRERALERSLVKEGWTGPHGWNL